MARKVIKTANKISMVFFIKVSLNFSLLSQSNPKLWLKPALSEGYITFYSLIQMRFHGMCEYQFALLPIIFQFQFFYLPPGHSCPYLFCNAKYQDLEVSPYCISQSYPPFYKYSLILKS